MSETGEIRIGTSGWHYDAWKGLFYEEDIRADQMLAVYSETFDTVEINNTFYQLPENVTVKKWTEQTPDGFLFAVKANRYITHMKKLKDPMKPVKRLINRVEALGQKLGSILFQLPGNWHLDVDRLRGLMNVLPEEQRYVVEFRHESWYADEIYDLLEDHNVALCIHDITGETSPQHVSTDFVYLRFHGTEGNYRGKYPLDIMVEWSKRILQWRDHGKTVYAYFNNDYQAHATQNARELNKLMEEV